MSLERAVLIDAIESSFALLPEIEGKVSYLRIPGLKGHETALSHPMVNMVTRTELAPDEADKAITAVRDHFTRERKAFGWVIGPSTKPADLPERLEANGLTKAFDAAGMALTDLEVRLRVNPAVRIREATPDDVAVASETMAEAFPAPVEVVDLMYRVLFRDRDRLKTRIYLAYLEGIDHAVGCSSMGFVPGKPIVHLRGAATNKQHRGRGIYSSLLARRLMDARKDGAEAAVIQAILTTSAPICRRLGFTQICDLKFYTWSPAT
jgi:N-acetylglutamate synthase-like GNAT family acetyltransferase